MSQLSQTIPFNNFSQHLNLLSFSSTLGTLSLRDTLHIHRNFLRLHAEFLHVLENNELIKKYCLWKGPLKNQKDSE